jgi:2,4-dienoyl-CoA reductase-like NADH-dependent reductase (Old Yellow Enzyme family)
MAEYKHLFTPIKLGSLILKNRIVSAPNGSQVADPVTFMVTDRAKAYYEEKACGGAALVGLVTSSVDEKADYFPANNFALWTDDIIPGLKELTEVCHKHDSKFMVQISHPGIHSLCHVQVDEVPVAPSQIPAIEVPNQISKELTKKEIWEIQDKFARAAERCVKAGVDAVEIMCAHDKLGSAFFSPLSNKRTDEYGGSVENRVRFAMEVFAKVRDAVGRDFPIGARMNVMELEPGGLTLEDGIEMARMLEAAGYIDWLGTVMATYKSIAFECSPFCANLEPGWAGEFSRKVKAAVKVPVSVAAKINDPGLADRMIAEGKCDYVYLARTLIADPHFPRKALEGKEEDIAPCIYCNQGCVARSFNRATTNGIRCTVNPSAGEEMRWGSWTFQKASHRRNVLIVGAGPAGMQCAVTAAQRGHNVLVYEKNDEVGGQARLIKKILNHNLPQTFLDYLDRQMQKFDVKVKFNAEITAENIDDILSKEKPDIVVLASGSRPARDGRGAVTTEPIPGWDRKNVFTYEDVLLDQAQIGQTVLIVDELADRITPGLAEMLAEQGKTVEVLTRWSHLSPNLHIWLDEHFAMGQLDLLGVKITPYSWVKEITDSGADCYNIHSGREFDIKADTIILATMKYSNTALQELFENRGVECHLIGDARAPRWIMNATHDGYKLGREI